MRTFKTYFPFLMICGFLSVGHVSAGSVTLDSGTRVQGKVTRQGRSIRVETNEGTYTFNISLVKSIDRTETSAVTPHLRSRKRKTLRGSTKAPRKKLTKRNYASGRLYGPVQEVERTRFTSPIWLNTVRPGYLHIGRTRHYVRGWELRDNHYAPVIGKIHSGTTIGRNKSGDLYYDHAGQARFKTLRWQTKHGPRTVELPSRTTIRLYRKK